MIEVLAFDLGGVLTGSVGSRLAEAAAARLRVGPAAVQAALDRAERPLQAGRTDQAGFWRAVLAELGRPGPPGPLQDLEMAIYRRTVAIDPEMVALVQALRRRYRVGCISNTNEPHASENRPRGLFDLFSPCVLSHEVGCRKPGRRIYEIFLARTGAPDPASVVFIDDVARYLEPARRLGMATVHFTGREALIEVLRRLGVEVVPPAGRSASCR